MRLWSFDRWTVDTPIVKHARAAVRNGFAVVFLRPGGKEPLCPLTARERKKAGPSHPCGVSHASTDERWVVRKAKQLEEDYGRINLGIAAHASRVVVIDADTPEQVESVQELLLELGDDAAVLAHQPTVQTPGTCRDGVWVHERGTHWYFNVPEGIEFPEYPGERSFSGGSVLRWGNSYTLVPPSERAEGPYISLAEYICDVPIGIAAIIRAHVLTRQIATADLLSRYHDDRIIEWSLNTPWHTLLEPDGWDFTGKLDRQCNCPVWRRPGDDASTDRSAIAHENECVRLPNVEGHGPLYIFSDNPPGLLAEAVARGQRTFTKLQYVSLTRYDGDESAAKVGEGIEPDFGTLWEGASGQSANDQGPYTHEAQAGSQKEDSQVVDQDKQGPGSSATGDDEKHPLTILSERLATRTGVSTAKAKEVVGNRWLAREADAEIDSYLGAEASPGSSWLPVGQEQMLRALRRDRSERLEGVLERSDGATSFPVGKLHELFGQSSSGKSFLMMTAILQQIRAGHRCLYCDFEDTLETFVDRYAIDLGIDIEPYITAGLLCYSNPSETPGDLSVLVNLNFRLVVVDSLSEVVSRTADGSLRDGVLMKRILDVFRRMANAGAAVVIIAHGSEKVDVPGSSLGASEIRQTLTGQDMLLHEKRPFDAKTAGYSLIYIAKDRGSFAGGDSDINERAANKVQRRLWGAMVVTPHPPELEHDNWYTTIEIEPATHAEQEPPKERKIDQAETLVIVYLNKREDQSARQLDMVDDLVDEQEVAERTVRRAIRKLIDDGMAHEAGESTTGGRPSPIIKLGPAPEASQEATE